MSASFAQEADLLRGLEGVYCGPAELAKATYPVVCLVDTEHPDVVRADLVNPTGHLVRLREVMARVEVELAGLPCLLVHYTQLTPEALRSPLIKAVLIGSRVKQIAPDLDLAFERVLKGAAVPILGLSGGYGLIVSAYGGKCGHMRRLEPGEPDPYPAYEPGWMKEWGACRVRIRRPDPLFSGLGPEIVVEQRHAWEVKTLPADFEGLAASDVCEAQAFRHRTKPVYGILFAAERYSDLRPDGRTVLRNFFRVAGIDVATTVPAAENAFRDKMMAGIDDLYASPADLKRCRAPFVCYIDTEHPDLIRKRQGEPAGKRHSDRLDKVRQQIQPIIPALRLLIVHYIRLRQSDLDNKALRAICISGRSEAAIDVMTRELFALIRETTAPTIGFCGGHQLVAQAYGAAVGPMRPLRPGEEDPAPFHGPGMFKEWGFFPVRLLKSDRLFRGLPNPTLMQEYHYGEVKELPAEFDLLASTDECRVQAIKHRGKILYGTQFHPEAYDEKHKDGQTLLRNFLEIAKQRAR